MNQPNQLFCCGVSHRTLPLDQRERIQPPREEWAKVLGSILARPGVLTGVLLCTCNRVEFYLKTNIAPELPDWMLDALGAAGEDREACREASYVLNGDEAVRQLFRVAAGLDSMFIGESEVLGQVKEAYSLACSIGAVQHVMHRLFHSAFRVGKQVRSETELGRGVRSMCGAALDLANTGLGGLSDNRHLLVGVGDMTRTLAARTRGLGRQTFINRTHCKAKALARQYGGMTRRFEALGEALADADAVFTSTGASEPIIDARLLAEAVERRDPASPLLICDLAVPRDVHAGDFQDGRLLLHDQNAIQAQVDRDEQYRLHRVEDAEEIVDEQVAAFWNKLDHGELTDSGQSLMNGAQRALERELRYCRRFRSPEEVEMLREFGQRLVNKVCGLGIVNLRAERDAFLEREG